MCNILIGSGISKDIVRSVRRSNPDGYSVLTKEWGLLKNPSDETLDMIIDSKTFTIYHFRYGTSGTKGDDFNTHPFLICNGKYYLYHNGVLGEGIGTKSDTHCLAESLEKADFETAVRVVESLASGNRFLIADVTDPLKYYTFGDWHYTRGILSSTSLRTSCW